MKNSVSIFLFLLLIACTAQAQNFSPDEIQVLTLQDKRTLGAGNELVNYLSSLDAKVVKRALTALANIGDSSAAGNIGEVLMNHSDKDVRITAAFALGQIPSAVSIDYLFRSIDSDKDSDVLAADIDALGRIGDEASYNGLLGYNKIIEPKINEAVALAIARYGMRKVRNEKGIERLIIYAGSPELSVRQMTAYAFARGMDKDLLIPATDALKTLASSDDPYTRMWAMAALGRIGEPADIDFIVRRYKGEQDWKVKVNILNAIPNYKAVSEGVTELLTSSVSDENIYVRVSALNSMGRLYSSVEPGSVPVEIKNFFASYFAERGLRPWQETAEALNTYSLIYKDEAKSELMRVLSSSESFDLKAAATRSFGVFNDPMIYKEVRDTISAIVQRYNAVNPNTTGAMIGSEDLAKLYRGFVEMLSSLDDRMDRESRNITRLIFTEFGSSRDPYITAVSLGALTDSLYLEYREETTQIILFDFNDLNDRDNPDVTQIYVETLGELGAKDAVKILEEKLKSVNYDIAKSSAAALTKITGNKYEPAAERYTSYNWDFLNLLPEEVFVTLNTSAGNIKLRLFPDAAPFTVVNFIKLAQVNYFDNTVFHRVIPNFVVQGGDPTGTGYSGPGYSIRSEFAPLSFTTGVVGMASSGKDTEGSQFFITHSPQYHLDGKYTIFGEVVEGMDVVDKLYIGDKLIDVMYP